MADEKINSTANNIQIDIDNLSYVDYLIDGKFIEVKDDNN